MAYKIVFNPFSGQLEFVNSTGAGGGANLVPESGVIVANTLTYDTDDTISKVIFLQIGNQVIQPSQYTVGASSFTIKDAADSVGWNGLEYTIVYQLVPGSTASHHVYEEEPTDSGDHTNYTLAHTPNGGTLTVFKNGMRQRNKSVDGDYTLSGATITFISANSSSDLILCDYDY